MEERILKFIAALRSAGVRISLAESSEAMQAVHLLGVKDREAFRLSLRATLVKEAQHLPIFDEYFDIYFGGAESPPLMNISDELSPEEIDMFLKAIQGFNQGVRQAMQKLFRGEPLTPQELERLAKMVGLTQMNNMRYRHWMKQRLLKALHFPEIQQALQELAQTLAEMGMHATRIRQLLQALRSNQDALEAQIEQFVGQQISENMGKHPPAAPLHALFNRPFASLSERDMERLRREVQRLANMLKTKIALRQKRAKNGFLDAKATLRANLKHANVPIELRHRQRTLKPKLVVLCDVSTSMRFCSELMLSLIFHLQELISKTHAFAFIDHLEYISPLLEHGRINQAVRQVLEAMPSGYYNTDLGYSLQNFNERYLSTLDSRTTLIMVGDGRNNYNDPRLDLFTKMARRCKRTIWITPENPLLWGTGDSDMQQYAPKCDIVLQAANLNQLVQAIDRLLGG